LGGRVYQHEARFLLGVQLAITDEQGTAISIHGNHRNVFRCSSLRHPTHSLQVLATYSDPEHSLSIADKGRAHAE
jgi:hypothetical protein